MEILNEWKHLVHLCEVTGCAYWKLPLLNYHIFHFVCIVDAPGYLVVYGLCLIGCPMDQSAVPSGAQLG